MKIKKKTLIFVIVGVLLLFLGFTLGWINRNKLAPASFYWRNNPKITPLATPTPASLVIIPTFPPTSEIAKVTRVIDGDTIEIEGGQRVRYIGIDTPETVDPRKPVQCFGVEAAKKNKELVEGKEVRLEKDITNKDKYGRLLRYVYVGDIFVNLELVKQGFAFSYTYPPDVKYQAEILAAEQEARENNLGLWQTCPLASPPN